MFKINDKVVYGSSGVCKIINIGQKNFGIKTDREYYLLNPVVTNSLSIFVPTDNQDGGIRRTMTKDEIYTLIKVIPEIGNEWIPEDQSRKNVFSEILQSGDQKRLIKMLKTIYNRMIVLEENGKKLPNADVKTMKFAEELLYNEIALVFDIIPEQVVPFIMQQIQI